MIRISKDRRYIWKNSTTGDLWKITRITGGKIWVKIDTPHAVDEVPLNQEWFTEWFAECSFARVN